MGNFEQGVELGVAVQTNEYVMTLIFGTRWRINRRCLTELGFRGESANYKNILNAFEVVEGQMLLVAAWVSCE